MLMRIMNIKMIIKIEKHKTCLMRCRLLTLPWKVEGPWA